MISRFFPALCAPATQWNRVKSSKVRPWNRNPIQVVPLRANQRRENQWNLNPNSTIPLHCNEHSCFGVRYIITTNQLHVSGIRKKISRSFCRISRAQRVKFKETSEIFSEFHKQGVDSYIIPWKVKFDFCCPVSLCSELTLLQIECSPVTPCFSRPFQ